MAKKKEPVKGSGAKSYKHKKSERVHIPSTEEEGYEQQNKAVADGKKRLHLLLNPVLKRGQDPELMWKHKYQRDARINDLLDQLLKEKDPHVLRNGIANLYELIQNQAPDAPEYADVDIRSLYRHEHISPEVIVKQLYKAKAAGPQTSLLNELFGNSLEVDELEKPTSYYDHKNPDGWTNRLIQGDSLLVMTSLLAREGMAGKIQTIYFDPPYAIKYGSNWQIKLNTPDVKESADESLSAEPEQIKAFRDTWEKGIHSYLSYLRERLLVARDLLNERGSCFVQISDENVHLVRNLLDEVFGSENQCATIAWKKGTPDSSLIRNSFNYILWYCKKKEENGKQLVKFQKLFYNRKGDEGTTEDPRKLALWGEFSNGEIRTLTTDEKRNILGTRDIAKVFRVDKIIESGNDPKRIFKLSFGGEEHLPPKGSQWRGDAIQMKRLLDLKRIVKTKEGFGYKFFIDDYPVLEFTNLWEDTGGNIKDMKYVVQTNEKIIQRCLLMTTDPGDLVLDPTCGSGTTAFVAEQWGRRWITIDTSRIAINIAKIRLTTAVFDYFVLADETEYQYKFNTQESKYEIKWQYNGKNGNADIRQGFLYKKVPHVKLKDLANDEPPEDETLYDQAEKDNKRIRLAGPFTVETLQNFEPVAPDMLDQPSNKTDEEGDFEELVRQRMVSAGINNGEKGGHVKFIRVEQLGNPLLHAIGYYRTERGEHKAYIHIGPRFGTVSKKTVNDAAKECRLKGDADWLVILGFTFESNIEGRHESTSMGSFRVDKVRMHDDLLQDGLLKKPGKTSGSFVTIGEPEIELIHHGKGAEKLVQVEIIGLDIYDPILDQLNARDRKDIAYWMVDDDYDGSNFLVKQIFFCGGEDEMDKVHKKLKDTLKVEIDEEAFSRIYGHISHPVEYKKGKKIAVRVVSQFGEESTKVLELK